MRLGERNNPMKGFHEFSLDETTRWSQMGRAGRRAYSAGVDAMLQVLRGDMTKEEFKELMGRDFDSMMKDPQYAKAVKAKMKKKEAEISEVFKSGQAGAAMYALIVGGKVVAKSTSSKKLRKLADEKYGGYTGYLPKDKSKPKVFVANWPGAKVGDTWKEITEGFRIQDWERMSKQHKSPEPVRIITKDRKTVDGRLKRFQYYDQGYATKGYYIILHPRKKGGEEVQIDDVDVMNIYWGDDAIRQRVLDMKEGINEATMKMGDPRLLDAARKALPAKLANDQKALNKMTRTMWEMWAESDGKIKLPELARLARTKLGMNEETEGGEAEGKKLNKPFRTPGEKKKFAVYVKNDSGNVVKVRFGDPNMEIRRDDPDRLKAFRSRHSCDDAPGPKWKARYWSCQMWRSDKGVSDIISEAQDNEPTDPGLWSQAIAKAKSKFDVYPSAYANAWAAKWYKSQGGGWKKATKEETEKSKEKAMNEEKLDEAVRAIIENSFLRRLDEEAEVLEEGAELLEECEEYDLSEMTDSEYNTLVESLIESGADFIIEEDGSLVVEEEQMDEGMKRTIRVRAGKIRRGKTAGRKGYRINKKGRVVKVPAAVLRRKKMKLKRAARRLKGKRSMISRKAKRSKRIGKRLKNRPQNR